MGEVFASAPFIVGRSEPSPTDAHIPAEESLCPVISHHWVNEEYEVPRMGSASARRWL